MKKSVRSEFDDFVKNLNIDHQDFHLVGMHQYESILTAIVEKFTIRGKKSLHDPWWWQSLKGASFGTHFDYAPSVLEHFIPSEETVWFVVEDFSHQKKHGNYWLYEGKIQAIRKILMEEGFFEYYIVSKKLEWLMGQNHHDVFFCVGDKMSQRLRTIVGKDSV